MRSYNRDQIGDTFQNGQTESTIRARVNSCCSRYSNRFRLGGFRHRWMVLHRIPDCVDLRYREPQRRQHDSQFDPRNRGYNRLSSDAVNLQNHSKRHVEWMAQKEWSLYPVLVRPDR